MSLHSALGLGSTFALTIPARLPGTAGSVLYLGGDALARSHPFARVGGGRNRETLFIYERFLKGTGFQVIPARSVRTARRSIQEVRPLAVVLDILLEGESTWELLAEFKALAGHSRPTCLGGHHGGQPTQSAGVGG